MYSKTFLVTDDHLKLLTRTYFGYNDGCEFGAPEVDPKRPYGNSDVYGDIAEILGIEPDGDDDSFTRKQKEDMLKTHTEMATVLQILAEHATAGISPGRYEATRYGVEWKRCD